MSALELRTRFVVVYRNAKGAMAGFIGPFPYERAVAEREWHLIKHPEARASVFHLTGPTVDEAVPPSGGGAK